MISITYSQYVIVKVKVAGESRKLKIDDYFGRNILKF